MPHSRRTALAAALAGPAFAFADDDAPGGDEPNRGDPDPGRGGPVVLLGDSVFDNGVYVPGGPAVIDHLGAALPAGFAAELRAVDGAVVADVPNQYRPADLAGAYAIVSAGGNDALRAAAILTRPVTNAAAVFAELADLRTGFTARYEAAVKGVAAAAGGRAAVCTIYDPNYPDPRLQKLATAALPAFNDVITRVAARLGLPVLDLRTSFEAPTDYANPIEPSVAGGKKLAGLIRGVVTRHDFDGGGCRFYTAA